VTESRITLALWERWLGVRVGPPFAHQAGMKDLRSLAQSLFALAHPQTPGLRRAGRVGAALAAANQLAMARQPAQASQPTVYGPHARRSPTGAPAATPFAKATTTLTVRALARGWLRTLTPDSWAPVHDAPHPAIVRLVRWAPIVMPAVVGSVLLTLMLILAARAGYPPSAPLTPSQVIPALFLTYLVWGALQGLALYFAPNGVLWSLAFFGMPPLLLVVMAGEVLGGPGAIFALAGLATALLLYSGARRTQTPAGMVEVTLLFGEWYRTLPGGYNPLLPGERIIVRLRTTPRAFTTAMQRVSLGPDRMAQARATATYVVQPHEAWRTASVRATWEAELRQRISASVRESLGAWRATPDDDLAAHGSIAQRTLDDTRAWARGVGVRILSVRAHDIAVGPPQRLAAEAPPQPAQPTHAAPRQTPRPTPRVARAPTAPPTPASARPAAHAATPSPAALEDLYEAVRSRQITDSQVIREIADNFAKLAGAGAHAVQALPFDPVSAARLLEEYADALDAARAARRPARRGVRSR